SVASSRRLSRELTLELQEMTHSDPSSPIQSAQRLLARIAARITTERNSDEITKQIHSLITIDHLRRSAIVYLRQSTEQQVRDNTGSTDFQRSLANVARSYGWTDAQ